MNRHNPVACCSLGTKDAGREGFAGLANVAAQGGVRAGTAVLAALLVVICLAAPALAQSTTCLRLVNELAALDSGGGFANASPRYRQYEAAVRDQKAQIAKTERASRQSGCDRGGGIFFANRALCDRIRSSLGQMYTNLDKLQRDLASMSPRRGGNDRQRRAILAEIQRNGCQGRIRTEEAAQRAEPRRRTLLEQIFGVRTYREDGSRGQNSFDPDSGLTTRYGTFRTLCVRTCDGYYFPISFSTVPDRFAEDEQICQAMCPGQDVQLFFHAMPSQESEDMISYRTEEPYAKMSTAFAYREAVKPECSCQRAIASGLTEIAGSGGVSEVVPGGSAGPALPLPVWRQDPGLDPETSANMNERFTVDDVARLARRGESVAATSDAAAANRSIRVVGPSFFPVQ